MAYAKQTWITYDENKSEEENIKSGAVGTAERMNHIEDGVKSTDTDLAAHKNDAVSHVTKSDRDKWDAKLQASDITNYITTNDFTKFLSGEEITLECVANFTGKESGSLVQNPHSAYFSQAADIPNPPISTGEISTANYTSITLSDGKLISPSVNASTRRMSLVAKFDVVSDIDRNNPGLFDCFGAITPSEKLALARKLVDGTIRPVAYASGSGASTTNPGTSRSQVNMQIWGTTWHGGATNTTSKIAMLEYKNQTGQRIQDDGCVYVILYAPPSDGTAPSVINIDQVYLEYKIKIKMSDVYVSKNNQFTPILIVAPTAGADDLDKYTKAGYYLCRTSTYATNVLNTPINIAFRLEVQELVSSGELPGVNQLLTTYHTNNTSFRRFTRNLYNGVWSVWREIPFVDQVQMNKVTQDNGDALIKVSDTETILDRVIASGA